MLRQSTRVTDGRLITLEGGEGGGKSTQAARLAAALGRAGLDVIATREPGGTPGAEAIRQLLLGGEEWDAETEALLHVAARRDHLVQLIWPALARGAWVVCDRFADSTEAYQGHGHGLPAAWIDSLHARVLGDFRPDLTFILDVPTDVGLARAGSRLGAVNRYERFSADFHERVRQGFLQIAAREADRCVVVDATATADTVTAAMAAAMERVLGLTLA